MQIMQDVVTGVKSKDQDKHLIVLSYDMEIPSLQVLLPFKEKDSLELIVKYHGGNSNSPVN